LEKLHLLLRVQSIADPGNEYVVCNVDYDDDDKHHDHQMNWHWVGKGLDRVREDGSDEEANVPGKHLEEDTEVDVDDHIPMTLNHDERKGNEGADEEDVASIVVGESDLSLMHASLEDEQSADDETHFGRVRYAQLLSLYLFHQGPPQHFHLILSHLQVLHDSVPHWVFQLPHHF
jgi:hypothetical protein